MSDCLTFHYDAGRLGEGEGAAIGSSWHKRIAVSLGYAVRALSGSRRDRRHGAVPLLISGGEQAIHESHHADRVIASHPGRRFHLELSDVRLQGGGHIQCRVHAEEGLDEGSVVVVERAMDPPVDRRERNCKDAHRHASGRQVAGDGRGLRGR